MFLIFPRNFEASVLTNRCGIVPTVALFALCKVDQLHLTHSTMRVCREAFFWVEEEGSRFCFFPNSQPFHLGPNILFVLSIHRSYFFEVCFGTPNTRGILFLPSGTARSWEQFTFPVARCGTGVLRGRFFTPLTLPSYGPKSFDFWARHIRQCRSISTNNMVLFTLPRAVHRPQCLDSW